MTHVNINLNYCINVLPLKHFINIFNDDIDIIKDIKILLLNNNIIKGNLFWDNKVPIAHWRNIIIKNNRIVGINICYSEMPQYLVENIILPPNLLELYINDIVVNDEYFSKLTIPENLEILSLDNICISDVSIINLKLPKNLKKLLLGNNKISSDGIKKLILPDSLEELYLNGNYIGSNGLIHMKLPNNIKILNLRDNLIGKESLKGLTFSR